MNWKGVLSKHKNLWPDCISLGKPIDSKRIDFERAAYEPINSQIGMGLPPNSELCIKGTD